MTETGRVVAVEPGFLWVETIRQSTCGSCSVQKGCGHGLLNKISDRNRQAHHIRALLDPASHQNYSLNDEVEIAVQEHVLVKAALIVYMVPLLSMLLGVMTAAQWGLADGAVALGALFGFVFGLLIVRVHAWIIRDDQRQQARVVGLSHPGVASPLPKEETLAVK